MTAETDHLTRAGELIDEVLHSTVTGTRDRPRPTTLVDLALTHAEDWLSLRMPTEDSRGGSSHPTQIEDQLEDRRLAHQVAADITRLPELCSQIERHALELYRMVIRLTQVVDHTKLPTNTGIPGCASCARRNGIHPGHFAPVYDKAPEVGLCRWCYDYDLEHGHWPPAIACDLYHRQSPRAAGVWLAKQNGAGSTTSAGACATTPGIG